jgi:hypothetical protein
MQRRVLQAPWGAATPSDPEGLAPLDPGVLERHAPDLHLAESAGRGRVSLWWSQVPAWPGRRLGLLGHFAAVDATAARSLLEAGCRELRERGCDLAVGPMDGNTWRSYRFVTEAGDQPRFALEPWQPAQWPLWWEAVGFSGFQTYHSALVPSLATTDPRLAAIGRRLEAAGVRLRPLRLEDYTGELERIHAVSAEAFVPNVLYTPLPRTEFLGMYQPLRPHVQAPLAWIAERDARMVGFVFSLPDLLQAQRGEPVDTLVVKTIARLPEPGLSGLGRLLMARLHAEARGLGFRRAIHALFHDQNVSGTLGEHSRIIRRYALYAKELA